MKGYDFSSGAAFDAFPGDFGEIAVVCRPWELSDMLEAFLWDESTVRECRNLDENVRHTSYDGYDFTSIVFMELENGEAAYQEINIFFSKKYLVLVFPEETGTRLRRLSEKLEQALSVASERKSPLVHLYYSIFDCLAADFSEMLEALEDNIEELSESTAWQSGEEQASKINAIRKTAYAYKKLLRAASYIGAQLTVDENKLFVSEHHRYLRSIETRFIKLYDFADNLFDLSGELLRGYENRLSAQTNEMVNKLTVITLFFGPMTVIAGIYGMNFSNMPEINWVFGYPFALSLMVLASVIIYIVLKKKKWL
jgi:magnesium transporter